MDQPTLFDFIEGRTRKENGQAQVLENERDAWVSAMMAIIRLCAESNASFTSDTVRNSAAFRALSKPHHQNCIGAAMSACAKLGWIRPTGQYVTSVIPSNHARRIAVWGATLK